jgi:hypothetical protein
MTTDQLPDPDSIKMFVGQLPKSWSENDVRQYFQEFGSIYLVNVLRDKITKQSRGSFCHDESLSSLRERVSFKKNRMLLCDLFIKKVGPGSTKCIT